MVIGLLSAALLAATPLPAEPPVRLTSQSARWTGLGELDGLRDPHASMFLISGTLRNAGPVAVAHVRLVYELLADGAVVASEWSYNRRAEGLRDPRVESGAAAAPPVTPLAPGEEDQFRMLFLRQDAPRFDSWRVRIVEAPVVEPKAEREARKDAGRLRCLSAMLPRALLSAFHVPPSASRSPLHRCSCT